MPPKNLTAETLDAIHRRVASIPPDARPLWGSLAPAGMARHMAQMMLLSLGELDVADKSSALTRRPLARKLFVEILPWPKGKLKAPKNFTPEPEGDFAAELERLRREMERFCQALAEEPGRQALHPIFGPMPLSYWSRLHALHFQHHCAQFGA